MQTPPAVMLAKYGLAPSRQRGQSFLTDDNVIRKVVDAVGAGPDDVVLEIGPGFGALTFGLAEAAKHVVAVEIDGGIARAFRQEYGETPGITLVSGDVLELDFEATAKQEGAQRLLVAGNIPYSLTSPLLRLMVSKRDVVDRAVLMIQAEVCSRLVAEAGDPDYSGLSAAARYHANVRKLFNVRRTCFHPRPNVDSGVVEIDFGRPPVRASDAKLFERVVRAAFGKRRKMLRQSMSDLLKEAEADASELEQASGIELSRRGETLNVDEFDALASALGRLLRAS